MISSRTTRRGFFGLFMPITSALANEKFFTAPPKPRFKIGDRVVTARICDETWIDFVHESEIAIAKNHLKSDRSFVLNNDFRNILQT